MKLASSVAKALVFAAVLLLPSSTGAAPPWYDSNWLYRQKITLFPTVTDSDLPDYPYQVQITDGANPLFAHAQTDGDDILFTGSDGTTKLDHELEKYDDIGGELVAWVKLPSLSSSVDTEIYLYYGYALAGNQENVPGVWSNGYEAVYHLHDDFNDSLAVHNGSNSGSSDVVGQIADAQDFFPGDGNDEIGLGTWSVSSSQLTIEAWIKSDDGFAEDDPRVISKAQGDADQDHVYMMSLYDGTSNENRLRFRLKTGTDDTSGTTVFFGTFPNGYLPDANEWYLAAMTYDGSQMRIIRDGLHAGSTAKIGSLRENAWPVSIGNLPGSSGAFGAWDGKIDEVRVSSVARSLDWMRAGWRSQSSPPTYLNAGPEESPPAPGTVSGTVFEDVNYGGGTGADHATALTRAGPFTLERVGVTVELYDSGGNHVSAVSPQITDTSGNYNFAGLTPGIYTVRVVNGSIDSTRAGSAGTELAVQTYRSDGDGETVGTGANKVGGEQPADADAPANAGSDTLADLQAPASQWTQSIVTVDASAGNVSGVDFGFNFDTIVNTNDAGQGSLRQFILNANLLTDDASLAQSGLTAGAETSIFMLPLSDPGYVALGAYWSIQPTTTALPTITDPVMLDGYTQAGASPSTLAFPNAMDTVLKIEINGTPLAGTGADGLTVSVGSSTIRGLAINSFMGPGADGIYLPTNGNNTIQGNFIGTDVSGTVAAPIAGYAIYLNSANNLVGGAFAGAGNIISGNAGYGVRISGNGNALEGNFVGTDISGSVDLGNGSPGIGVFSGSNISIGSGAPGAGNLISGNNTNGIWFNSSPTTVTVQGNRIGTDIGGTLSIPNGGQGVLVNSPDTTIGGTAPGEGNLISGNNGDGLGISSLGTNTVVQGNRIGTDVNGTADLGNTGHGIQVRTAGNVIGGTAAGAGNIIAFNNDGVFVGLSGSDANRITGNSIFSNGDLGIDLDPDGVGTGGGSNDDKAVPIIIGVTPAGSDFTVVVTTTSGDTVEYFRANNGAAPLVTPDGTGAGEGFLFLGSCLDNGACSGPHMSSVTDADPLLGTVQAILLSSGLADGDVLTATATDAANNTSEFASNALVGLEISGTVFEDVNYGGGAGVDYATALTRAGPFTIERSGVTVELYDSGGAHVSAVSPQVTDASGNYSFIGLTPDSYSVRVVNGSVTSTRAGSNGTELAVQTYRIDSLLESPGDGAKKVGGELPINEDAAANSGAQTLASLQGTDLDADTITEWTQSIVTVDASGGDVSGVDFGFNFDTIVNTNDKDQGSLRRFIANTNLLTDNSSLTQGGLTAGIETSLFMIPSDTDPLGRPKDPGFDAVRGVAVITPVTVLLPITSAGTAIDGTTQTSGIGDTNFLTLGYVGPVGLGPDATLGTADEPTLSGVAGPEVEIVGSSAIKYGLQLPANDIVVRGIALYGFGTAGLDANIFVSGATTTGCIIEHNVLGTPADSFTDPVAQRSALINVMINSADDGFVRNNLLGYVGREHVRIVGTALNWQVNDNEIRGGGQGGTFGGVTLIAGATGELHRNLITEDAAASAILAVNAAVLIEDNTLSANASGGVAFFENAGGLRGSAQILRNEINYNGWAGVGVLGQNGAALSSNQVQISQNHFSANAGISIDLMPNWSTDGITLNDGTLLGDSTAGNVCGTLATSGNVGLDFPVIDSALLDAGTTTVNGRACPGTQVEIYLSVADADLSDTLSGTDYGEGVRYLGTAPADPTTGEFTLGGITGLIVGDAVAAIDIDGSNNTSEFGANVAVASGISISGTVFEDVNYGGGAGVDRATALTRAGPFMIERSGVTVELYDSGGAHVSAVSPQTTDASGNYSFADLAPDTYTVRVVSGSVTSARAGSNGTELAVQTYRIDSLLESPGDGAKKVGGELPINEDAAANSGVQTLASLQGTDLDADTITEWTQSIVTVDASGGDVTDVDFGFNFDTVVNTNDKDQGSLRQFILNANVLTDNASLAQAGLTPAVETSVFMLPGAGDPLGRPADPQQDFGGNSGGEFTIRPASALPQVNDPVHLNGTTQAGSVANAAVFPGALNGTLLVEIDGTLAGGTGLVVDAGSSVVRGFVINRFPAGAVHLRTAGGDLVAGNYVGTDVTGLVARPNGGSAIEVDNVAVTTVGGAAPADRNLISGNTGLGIEMSCCGTSDVVVRGNFVGVDATGSAGLGNGGEAIYLIDSSEVTIGGTGVGEGNVVSSNFYGIVAGGAGLSNLSIQGNSIGVDATGTLALGNTRNGIEISDGTSVTIGGAAAGAGNVISNNGWSGMYVVGIPSSLVIQGNFVGTDRTGTVAMGNGFSGVDLQGGTGSLIGGSAPLAGNLFSGNGRFGIEITAATNGTVIQGNWIGTDLSTTAGLPNTLGGILVANGSDALIGGPAISEGNVVAFNPEGILVITGGNGNAILSNTIHSNTNLGIDLDWDGVTVNDAGDVDSGPNDLLNFPELSSAVELAGTLTVDFDLDVPAGDYRIEFFTNPGGADVSGFGEGEVFTSAVTVIHTGSGVESFSHAFPGAAGDVITSTATEESAGPLYGSTSEFSGAITAVTPASIAGTVYHDVNVNDVLDPGELGIGTVWVKLLDGGGSVIQVVPADPDSGIYTLPNVTDGDYTVIVDDNNVVADSTPTAPVNWLFQNPATGSLAVAVAGVDIAGRDFGLTFEFDLAADCACGYEDRLFTQASITIDGDMTDWALVFPDGDNNACDATDETDLDYPVQSTGRNLLRTAVTYDASYFSMWTQRVGSSNNIQNFVYYADTSNDGIMQAGEPVIVAKWQGNTGTVTLEKHSYDDLGSGGDPLLDASGFADGYSMPGDLTFVKTLTMPDGTGKGSTTGATDGTQMEWTVSWAELGVAPGAAIAWHIGSTNANPGSAGLGAQIDDNLGGCGGQCTGSNQFAGLIVTPISGGSGQMVYSSHTFTNTGNGGDLFDLTWTSSGDFAPAGVTFYDDLGTVGQYDPGVDVLLGDTDGDSDPDTGVMSSGASFDLLIAIEMPGPGTTGSATVTATATSNYVPGCGGTVVPVSGSVDIPIQIVTKLVKRAFEADGTPITNGATVPRGVTVKFLIYLDNPGAALTDVSVQDVLDAAFQYQANSTKVDDTLQSSVVCPGGVCDEAAILTSVEGQTASTDGVDGDAVSYTGASSTVDVGDEQQANAQLDVAADSVWALLFTVTMQ